MWTRMQGFVRWQFRTFATRLLVWIGLLVLLLLAGIYLVVESTLARSARSTVTEALEVTASALHARLTDQRGVLLDKLRLLSSDFAFKQAWADGDPDTLRSALDNHRTRVHAHVMQLVDLEGHLKVSSDARDRENAPHPDAWLLQRAIEHEAGEASGFVFVHGELLQYVVSPLLTPQHSAWVVMGIRLDEVFAKNLSEQTRSEITLFWQSPAERVRIAGALPSRVEDESRLLDAPENQLLTLSGRQWLQRRLQLDAQEKGRATAVLMRSFDEAMAPFYRLRNALLVVCASALAMAIVAAIFLARRVTDPVRRLGESARALEAGEYQPVRGVRQADELGALATQFNHMLQGLQERDAVRGVLGKVVSSAVAEELLNNPPVLGGELRSMTVMFSDIRNFTSLSEQFPATTVIEFLNEYLSEMSACIDAESGVVDKYIGDAIMALFGAPLRHLRHAENAVRAALAMQEKLVELAPRFAEKNWPLLHTGIGIHTGDAVVGNMGSTQRLNYTAIGDTVNLASRLEGLCKHYGWPVLVSDAVVAAVPELAFLELDRVRVKGRAQAVGVYAALTSAQQAALHRDASSLAFMQAMAAWRAGDFLGVLRELSGIGETHVLATVAALYRRRVREFSERGMPSDWKGVYDYDSK